MDYLESVKIGKLVALHLWNCTKMLAGALVALVWLRVIIKTQYRAHKPTGAQKDGFELGKKLG